MDFINTKIPGLVLIEPRVFSDDRGYFFESYSKTIIDNVIGKVDFVQDNQSLSDKGVLRGLHFQNPPFEQGKLVRVIKGRVFDVAVDIRKESPSYGEWFGIELTEENKTMMYIPPGFAHGFQTLEDNTIFSYKCTNYYNKESEGCLQWNDPTLNISWKNIPPIISDKDLTGSAFNDLISLF